MAETSVQRTPGPDSVHLVPLAASHVAINHGGREVVVPVNVAHAAPNLLAALREADRFLSELRHATNAVAAWRYLAGDDDRPNLDAVHEITGAAIRKAAEGA